MVVLDLKTIHKGNVIIVSRKLDTCILNTISFFHVDGPIITGLKQTVFIMNI